MDNTNNTSNANNTDKNGQSINQSSIPNQYATNSSPAQGATRPRHVMALIVAILVALSPIIIYIVMLMSGPISFIVSGYLEAYIMTKEIPFVFHVDYSDTRAMIKTNLVDDMNSLVDDVQDSVDEIGGLDLFNKDAEAKELFNAMQSEIELMREKYIQDANDVIDKFQQTADSMLSTQAVDYWVQEPTADEQNYIREKTITSDANGDFWAAKNKLMDYLSDKLDE